MSDAKDKKILKSLICPYCADTFTRESVLKAHMLTCEDRNETDEKGNRPEPFTNPDATPLKDKDPAQMTEIERLEYELSKKRAEIKAAAEAEVKKTQNNVQILENKGLHVEPIDSGKFRELVIKDHEKLSKLFDEQEQAGYDHVVSFQTPTGLIFVVFKKR